MNETMVNHSGKSWNNLKLEILDTWSGISSDEIDRTHGSIQAIYGLLQQKIALHRDSEKAKVVAMLEGYTSP